MSLTLNLSYSEQNDNKAIILTDNTTGYGVTGTTPTTTVLLNKMYEIAVAGTYNFIALGSADNNVGTRFVANANATINLGGSVYETTPLITDITGADLTVSYTDSAGVVIVKNTVDLYTEFTGPWALQSSMIYTIDASLLGDTADIELPDGLYSLVYSVESQIGGAGATETDSLAITILVYGQVKLLVYEKLRAIPDAYLCEDTCREKTLIAEADLCAAYLAGIERSAYVAKSEELLAMLTTLNNIILNGSNITW